MDFPLKPCAALVTSVVALVSPLGLSVAHAQLTPVRAYYGVDRPIPIEVRMPEGIEGTPTIVLHEPVSATVVASSMVEPGRVDLAAHFPLLWRSPTPRLLYAQLTVGLEKVGPPLVLRPLVEPKPAMLLNPANNAPWFMDPRTGKPSFDGRNGVITFGPAEESAFTGLRVEREQIAVVRTTLGEIRFAMRPDAAPNTVQNFLDLVRGGFYTDIQIHRIVPVRSDGTPFVIQFGDPTASGNGGPGYSIDLERSILPHDLGVLSMARATEPNTAGSQVFICLSREGTKHLDGRYAAFAEAVTGAEVIRAIAAVPVNAEGRPAEPPRVLSITLEDAPPYGTGPKPLSWRDTPEGVR